jgi:redox-sensing transcriptional repressor
MISAVVPPQMALRPGNDSAISANSSSRSLQNGGPVITSSRRGFPIAELIAAIEQFLGWDNQTKAVLVGVGNLGTALLGYQGLETLGLRIAGAFDRDPTKIGKWIQGRKVQPISQLAVFVRRSGIRLGVLTVPAAVAQETADLMIRAGIRGIWNLSPARLEVPAGVVTQKEDLAEGLAVLSHKLQHLPPADHAKQPHACKRC